jgi:phospholipid/cholesterol/gamma-HCH transport system substrate-binding protein
MNSSRATELKVGIISLIGVAILILGLMWGKQRSLNTDRQMYHIHFPTSAGLLEGDVVSVNGVKKGRVEKLTIDSNGVMVDAAIDGDIKLHSDATATIMMLELMGGKKIEIAPGRSSAFLDPSMVMQGTTAEDIPSAMAMLGTLNNDVTRVLFRLDTLLGSMNQIMGDKQFVQSVKNSIQNLDATLSTARAILAENKQDLHETLVNTKEMVVGIKDFIEKNRPLFERTVSDADKTLNTVDGTIAHADSTIATINEILSDIKKGNGVAGKLIYDKQLGERLDSTLTNAHKLIQLIMDNGVNVNLRLGTRP